MNNIFKEVQESNRINTRRFVVQIALVIVWGLLTTTTTLKAQPTDQLQPTTTEESNHATQ